MFQSIVYLAIVFTCLIHGFPYEVDDGNDRNTGTPTNVVNPLEQDGGDLIIPPLPRGVAAIPANYYRWPNGTIPYGVDSSILPIHQTLIEEQMRTIENRTRVNGVDCVTFRPKTVNDTAFLLIRNYSGCSATLGYMTGYWGNRYLNLIHSPSYSCMAPGLIQHELLHTLGFYHEQSRPDRDDYVAINWANIKPGQEYNYDKYNSSKVDTQQTPYDYGSILHYARSAFSINSSIPAIVPTKNATAVIGRTTEMSPIDILEVQMYYGCIPLQTSTTTTTTTTVTRRVLTTTRLLRPLGSSGQKLSIYHSMTFTFFFLLTIRFL